MTARVVVVGLGPAGPDLVPACVLSAIARQQVRFVRTTRHPAAEVVAGATSFDEVYERAATLDEVYATIVERLVEAALTHGEVLYAVPGSPVVAERTVAVLIDDERVDVEVVPAMSFLDLAWVRLGVDPLAQGVRIVDGHSFEASVAAQRGPFLVAQCDRADVLERVKLTLGDVADAHPGATMPSVSVLARLGTAEESIVELTWHELDRVEADHLTSLWIPALPAPVAPAMARFVELVATLRRGCPWDREQTHESLRKHLLEETYEVLEVLDTIAQLEAGATDTIEHDEAFSDELLAADEALSEELGDLLFQVVFHATIAAERGAFTLADVADGIHDKLYTRHPHVFGAPGDQSDGAATNSAALSVRWEQAKRDEKGRESVFDGMPGGLPALAYATKVRKKAAALGVVIPAGDTARLDLDDAADERAVGELLLAVVDIARRVGVDPEGALRCAAGRYELEVRASERGEASAE